VSPGCDRLDRVAALLRDHDLEFHYLGDDAGQVERASVSVDTRVIATARHMQTRVTADPALTEIEVEETHFVRGTLDVTYRGRITFGCAVEQAFCVPLRVTPVSGTRARNVFWRWPARMGADMPGPIDRRG
jgi:Flp pilus assembly secretin CpaC